MLFFELSITDNILVYKSCILSKVFVKKYKVKRCIKLVLEIKTNKSCRDFINIIFVCNLENVLTITEKNYIK